MSPDTAETEGRRAVVDDCDVLVAGAGIAGLTAAAVGARLGRKTIVLEGDLIGGHLLTIDQIEGLPGHPDGLAGYDLCPMSEEDATNNGADFRSEHLQKFSADGAALNVVGSRCVYRARTLILAMGTRLKTIGIPGEERLTGKGVSQCASCDGPLMAGRPVVVVGGGDSAMQEALTLARTASEVTIFCRGRELSGQTSFRSRIAGTANIKVRFETVVEEIAGGDTVSSVRIRRSEDLSTETIRTAGVFVFIGLAPNTTVLTDQIQLDPQRRVPTDSHMRTALPGVFAAGTIRSGTVGRAASAAGDGASAGIAADRYLNDRIWINE